MNNNQQPSGLQKPDKKELQKTLQYLWSNMPIGIKIPVSGVQFGDTFTKFFYNGKTYKIEIKEVKK